jgi:2-alkenal reductase
VAADEAVTAQLGFTGIVVAAVVPNSPAEHAGLSGFDARAGTFGDVITEVDSRPVRQLTELTDRLEQAGVGGTVNLTVSRNDRLRKVDLPVVDIGTR